MLVLRLRPLFLTLILLFIHFHPIFIGTIYLALFSLLNLEHVDYFMVLGSLKKSLQDSIDWTALALDSSLFREQD